VTPTRFDIYVRQDNRWQLKGSMAGEDKDSALAQGSSMDAGGEFQGVRIMAVTEYGEGRAPLETLAWISPHLSNVAAITRQMKRQASAASENVAARDAASADVGEEPRPGIEPPSPASSADGRRQTNVKSPFRSKSPPDPGAQARQLAGKDVSNTVISIAIAILAFVLVSILTKNFGASVGVSTAHQGKVAFGTAGLAFLISACVLLGRVYHPHVTEFP
jgi:hypothetical protein